MLMGVGDIFSTPTLQDCETSWNPITGLECIVDGSIVQQVASSIISPSLLPGIFPVSDGTDGNGNPAKGSDWVTIAVVVAAIAAGFYYFKEIK